MAWALLQFADKTTDGSGKGQEYGCAKQGNPAGVFVLHMYDFEKGEKWLG